uniref:VWFC domain-containing protein n=1 Tax=Eptatretus burgeri TaxID=7764 RepID=A0A8C4QCA8_EPTBU
MPRLEPCLVLLVSFALTCRVLAQLSTNPCIPASNSTSSPCVELAESSTSSQKDCSQARCAVRFSAPCPRHSDLIEGLVPQGECCPLPSRCACRPQATCPPALCPSGSKALRVSMATGEPGNCCDAYECRTAPLEPGGEPAGCFARGKLRGEGARWRADRCTVCRCVSGRAHCTVPACAQRCDRPARLPGECCPRCRGE